MEEEVAGEVAVALSTATSLDQGSNNCFQFFSHHYRLEDTPLLHNLIEKLKTINTAGRTLYQYMYLVALSNTTPPDRGDNNFFQFLGITTVKRTHINFFFPRLDCGVVGCPFNDSDSLFFLKKY